MKFIGGKVFYQDSFKEIDFEVEGGRFKTFGNFEDRLATDLAGKLIIPGLTDLHTHGAVNCDTCDGRIESIERFAKYMMEKGITQFVPTTMTFPEEILSGIFASIRGYDNSYAQLVGIHMEGPFISRGKIGAQNPNYLQVPDLEMTRRLDNLSGGLLRIISMAPEIDGAMEYAKELSDEYIISLAHSECDYKTADQAFKNGFSHLTHMYNAMNPIHHRKPGPIIAAYEAAKTVELITDGVHIHPAVVRFSFDAFGDRLVLVSDSMRATGLEDGIYDLGGQEVEVKGRTARLVDKGNIAGSATNLFDCMKMAIDMGVEPQKAIRSATTIPAKRLGLEDMGQIREGYLANFLVLNQDYSLDAVYIKGEKRC